MTDSRTSAGVAVVTGASSGVGAATARERAAAGFAVALLARRLDRIAAIAEEIGNGAIAIEADVTDRASLVALNAAAHADIVNISSVAGRRARQRRHVGSRCTRSWCGRPGRSSERGSPEGELSYEQLWAVIPKRVMIRARPSGPRT
ncbi:SDR family NAD(P)-dependent oxidoreductase [Streptomyces sp. NPDC000941]